MKFVEHRLRVLREAVAEEDASSFRLRKKMIVVDEDALSCRLQKKMTVAEKDVILCQFQKEKKEEEATARFAKRKEEAFSTEEKKGIPAFFALHVDAT